LLPPQGIASGTTALAFLGVFTGGLNIFLIASGVTGCSFLYHVHACDAQLINYYNEPAIFKNVLYAFIVSIVSSAVIVVLVFAVLISAFLRIYPTNTPSVATPVFTQIIIIYAVVFVVALAFGIVNACSTCVHSTNSRRNLEWITSEPLDYSI